MSSGAGCAVAALLAFGCASAGQQAKPKASLFAQAKADAAPSSAAMVLPGTTAAPVATMARVAAPAALAQKAPPAEVQPPPGADSEAHGIVAGVDAFYGDVDTFKAAFKQRVTFDAKGARGTVRFEKPNKMSWRYDNGNRVVSDGQRALVYEKESKYLYEQPLEKTLFPAALSFLLARGSLEQAFNFTKLDAARMHFVNGHVLQAEPRVATTAYERLVLYVDATSYQVRRVQIMDAQGNRNRFDFSAFEVNRPMPEHEFEFTPPPGTRVIRP
jgi:outer membrane lipoprotein carrier protein